MKVAKYMSQVKGGIKTGLAYRFHYIVNLIMVPVNVIIFWFLWKSIYTFSNLEVINGFTQPEIVTYYVIAMVVGFITWTDVDKWMENAIIQGNLINSLMKPMSHFANSVFFTIGMNWLGVLIQFIPVVIIGLLFGLHMVTGWYILLFIISVAIAIVLYFIIAYLTGLTAFWLKRIGGLVRMRRAVVAFLAGGFIPLTFFPETLQRVFLYLPFQHIRFTPVSIYMQKFTITESVIAIAIGLVWTIVLYLLSKIIWKKAFKKFAGAGT